MTIKAGCQENFLCDKYTASGKDCLNKEHQNIVNERRWRDSIFHLDSKLFNIWLITKKKNIKRTIFRSKYQNFAKTPLSSRVGKSTRKTLQSFKLILKFDLSARGKYTTLLIGCL